MKKTSRMFKSLVRSRMLAVMAVGITIAAAGMSAQAATVGDLLKYLPADAQLAIGLPDVAAVEKTGAPLLVLPMLSEISTLGVQLGGDTLAEGLENSGINASAPAVAFLQLSPTNDPLVCGVLMVKDADKVRETLVSLLGGEGSPTALSGDLEGRYVAGSGVGYLLEGDKLFVASSEALLKDLASRIGDPATVNYGKGGPKDEVVAFTRIDILEQSNMLSDLPPLAMLKPVIDTIKPFSDELILAIGEDAGKAYVRVAARDTGGAPLTAPAPLGLHGFMDPEAPVVMNLRLTTELINAVSMALMNNPDTRQAGGYLRIASGLLDDELAISFSGMKNDSIPNAVIAAKVKNAESVPNLLRMIAKIEEPAYQLEETNVYVYPNVTDGTDLHIATAGQTLVITPGDEALKTAVGRFAGSTAGDGVDKSVVNRGVYGFLMVDGAKAKDLPSGMIPSNLNLANLSLALTMGVDGEWRELVLTSPSGFEGVADLMKDLL